MDRGPPSLEQTVVNERLQRSGKKKKNPKNTFSPREIYPVTVHQGNALAKELNFFFFFFAKEHIQSTSCCSREGGTVIKTFGEMRQSVGNSLAEMI